jgi:methionine biosynthesis protein MetW
MRKEIIAGLPAGIDKIIREVTQLGWRKGSKILDCGCGDGKAVQFLAQKLSVAETFGIDISHDKLEQAKAKGLNVKAVDLNREQIPFSGNYFDLVFCNHVIEHLLDPDHLLDEVFRTLKNDGIFILTTPNLAAWYNRILLFLGYQPHFTEVSTQYNVGKIYFGKLALGKETAIGGHLRLFTYHALKELLKLHGFCIKTSFSYGHPYLLNSKIIGIFEKLSQYSKTLSSTLCFICKKVT